MPKINAPDEFSDLRKFLIKRHKTRKPIRSWHDISVEICEATGQGINRGLLSNIARGNRKPANHIIEAINKTYHKRFRLHEVMAHVMPLKCGHLPSGRRCPICHPPAPRQRRESFKEIYQRAMSSIYKES